MLRFTKRADYGLMAIHYIAFNDGFGAVSAKRIAEEFAIPPELMAKILQRLAKQRLVVSTNGPKGGYVLARRPTEITVGQVIRVLEGPLALTPCVSVTAYRKCDECVDETTCGVRLAMKEVRDATASILDNRTLAALNAQVARSFTARRPRRKNQ